MYEESKRPSQKSLQALDVLNIFLADVRDGVGPYLAIYLKASQNWNPASIGIAMSAATIATVVAQTPAGALVDKLQQKRMLIVLAAAFVSVGCIAIALLPILPVIIGGQVLIGIAAAVFPPAVAAITLGLVGHSQLDKRVGRNEAFNHAGNVLAAILAGLVGHFITRKGIFFLVAAMGAASAVSVLRIRPKEIDHEQARGTTSEEDNGEHPPQLSGFMQLLSVDAFSAYGSRFNSGNWSLQSYARGAEYCCWRWCVSQQYTGRVCSGKGWIQCWFSWLSGDRHCSYYNILVFSARNQSFTTAQANSETGNFMTGD